jgi:hypothetical protein
MNSLSAISAALAASMGLDMGTFMGRLSSSERAGKEAITFLKKSNQKTFA